MSPVRPPHAQRREATRRAAQVGVPQAAAEHEMSYAELYRWCLQDGVTIAPSPRGGRRPPGRSRQRMGESLSHVPDEFGTLEVTCWCESRVVRVPAEAVGAGTGSCGLAECREPAA